MESFQRRSFARKIIFSAPSVAALAILTALVGRSAFQSYFRFQAVSKVYLDIKKEREELAQKKNDLENRLKYLSSSYGLEKELREKFGMKKPEEEMAVIVERKVSAAPVSQLQSETLWHKLKAFFKGFSPDF